MKQKKKLIIKTYSALFTDKQLNYILIENKTKKFNI